MGNAKALFVYGLFFTLFFGANAFYKGVQKPCTTVIGAYPKPANISLPDWFQFQQGFILEPSKPYEEYIKTHANSLEELDQAVREVVQEQVSLGIDIPTDGEIRRENYIYYHCRHLDGIDFSRLTKKTMRAGAWEAYVPTIVGPVKAKESFLPRDFHIAQTATLQPVKITIPGPMTIADTLADDYYHDDETLGYALAKVINQEVMRLVEAGCTWIQVDEPLLARFPEQALKYGIAHVERCFKDVPDHVMTAVHICCGYPQYLDQKDAQKADLTAYFKLASALDTSIIKAVSLEDTHRRNDPALFKLFIQTAVILGVIDISSSRVESVQEIREHILQALEYIDPERLFIAPDCGLGMLPLDIVHQKLTNMVQATQFLRKRVLSLE